MSPLVKQRNWRNVLATVAVVIFIAIRAWQEQESFEPPTSDTQRQTVEGQLAPGDYRVLRVVDGDTLLLEHARTRVRLQGIDTPETVKEDTPVEDWGPEATQYTRRFVQDAGGRVRIEIDGEAEDRFGRALVFVWFKDRLLNEELVRQGLAKAKLGYDYGEAKKQLLRRAENAAQAADRGIWSR